MESRISDVIARIDDAGGMYAAVESGLVQRMIGESAIQWQNRVENGEQRVVGVNCYQGENEHFDEPLPYRPDRQAMAAHVEALEAYKKKRSSNDLRRMIDSLSRAAQTEDANLFAAVVDAACAGLTHGEIIACLREVLGFGVHGWRRWC